MRSLCQKPRNRIKAQRSGFDPKRRCSEVRELSPLGGSEGYGTCIDDRMAKGHCELRGAVSVPLQIRSDTSLPQRIPLGTATSNKEENHSCTSQILLRIC